MERGGDSQRRREKINPGIAPSMIDIVEKIEVSPV